MNEKDFEKLVKLYKRTSALESGLRESMIREAALATVAAREAATLKSIANIEGPISAEQRSASLTLSSALENMDDIWGRVQTSANRPK